MSDIEYKPRNQDTDPLYNREPGIALVPGSNFVKEVAKFEQFHSPFTIGAQPGNPYTYRPYPKMLYKADKFNGKIVCMGAHPNPMEFMNPAEFERAWALAE